MCYGMQSLAPCAMQHMPVPSVLSAVCCRLRSLAVCVMQHMLPRGRFWFGTGGLAAVSRVQVARLSCTSSLRISVSCRILQGLLG